MLVQFSIKITSWRFPYPYIARLFSRCRRDKIKMKLDWKTNIKLNFMNFSLMQEGEKKVMNHSICFSVYQTWNRLWLLQHCASVKVWFVWRNVEFNWISDFFNVSDTLKHCRAQSRSLGFIIFLCTNLIVVN